MSKHTNIHEVAPGIHAMSLEGTRECFEAAKKRQHPHEDYGRQVIEMVDSLNVAAHEAGRVPFTIVELRSLTVEQLILQLASNHIRFVFRRPD